ncbi:DUF3368 domain-containing protein [Spirosoma arcticum]
MEIDAVISDTSCFILLEKIDELALLKECFRAVYTTPTVAAEFGISLPDWVQVREVIDKAYLRGISTLADPGEISVIALAGELPDCLLILDDDKARKVAESFNLRFTGTLGVLVRAKALGKIAEVAPIVAKIRETDFRASESLLTKILKSVGE